MLGRQFVVFLVLILAKHVWCDDSELEEEIIKEMHPDSNDKSVTDAIINRNTLAENSEAEIEKNKTHPKYENFLHEDAKNLTQLKEADVMVDEKDEELISQSMNPDKDKNLQKRGMIPYARKLWIDREIPYEFDHKGTARYSKAKVIEEVLKSMDAITKKTCLKFRPKASGDRNWLRFFRGSGCYSGIGRKYWSKKSTDISLSEGCIAHSIIVHELLHALGFFHEQSRPDRDSFVTIDFNKVNPSMVSNFDKHASYDLDVQKTTYDYLSVMHYGNNAFTINGDRTIISKEDVNQPLGGQDLSELDVKELNKMYSCSTGDSANWSTWSAWSDCFKDWRSGCISQRQRFCLVFKTDPSRCPGADEYGVVDEQNKCEAYKCDETFVHPHWSSWGEYNACSRSCGEGYFSRNRQCNNPPPKSGVNVTCIGHPTKTSLCRLKRCLPKKFLLDVDFENGFAPWTQDADLNMHWKLSKGSSPSTLSGPKESFLTSQYATLSTNGAYEDNKKARIISPEINPEKSPLCVSFYYEMNGKNIGYLDLYIKTKSNKFVTLWMKDGHQGNEWKTGSFTIPKQNETYQIVIEGKTGTHPYTDIAVDDIRIEDGKCYKGSEGCKDYYPRCYFWKYLGFCYKFYNVMLKTCCATCSSMAECENNYDKSKNTLSCEEWAKKGECKTNRLWMWKKCCSACRDCADVTIACKLWAKRGYCEKSQWMKKNCKTSCKICEA